MTVSQNQIFQYGLIFGEIDVVTFTNGNWFLSVSGFANKQWFYFDSKMFRGKSSFTKTAKVLEKLQSVAVKCEIVSTVANYDGNANATLKDCLQMFNEFAK